MTPRKRRAYTRLSSEDRAAVTKRVTSMYPGMSLDRIAFELAERGLTISRGTVRTLLLEAGVTLEPPGRTRRAKPKQGGAS